jgi:hypothetical protein
MDLQLQVGGGSLNTASGAGSSVVGGASNTACGVCSFVGGGFCNEFKRMRKLYWSRIK